MNTKTLLGFLALILLISISFSSCSSTRKYERKARKKQAEVDKNKQVKEAERTAEYEATLQMHYDIQTKETQKEMRRNYKKAERFNANKKDIWIVRVYKNMFQNKVKTKKRRIHK